MVRLIRGRGLRLSLLVVAIASLSMAAVALAHGERHGFAYKRHYGTTGWVNGSSNATTLTVRDAGGRLHGFAVTTATKYVYSDGSGAMVTDAKPNRIVKVRATPPATSGGNPVAQRVVIQLAELAGEVTSNAGGTLTIADGQGFTRTVNTTGSTRCTQKRATVPCSTIPNGSVILAAGKVDPDGTTLDASRVWSRN